MVDYRIRGGILTTAKPQTVGSYTVHRANGETLDAFRHRVAVVAGRREIEANEKYRQPTAVVTRWAPGCDDTATVVVQAYGKG